MDIILFLNRNRMLVCMHGNYFNYGHNSDLIMEIKFRFNRHEGALIRDIIKINESEGALISDIIQINRSKGVSGTYF